jgi:chemotaxis protein methyltransferase CheR
MKSAIFNRFREIIYNSAGISLSDKKEALVSARVSKRMRTLGIEEPEDYLKKVVEDASGEEIIQLLDAISTNVTHFFRESEHFDFLSGKITEWYGAGQRKFRFWSAGCSTGEEPYTLAMTILETMPRNDSDIRILATDISTRVLKKSSEGIYEKRKVDQIPPLMLERYFDHSGFGEKVQYQVHQNMRNLITFKRLNLSKIPFPMQGPMDAIFCRNVMIYFDNDIRKNLLEEYYRLLRPGGILFVGHAESLTGMLSGFKSLKPSIYMK